MTRLSILLITLLLGGVLTSHNLQAQVTGNDFGSNTFVLITESDSYVPATYSAAAPIAIGSNLRAIVVGPSQNYNYDWYLNGRKIDDYSGFSQNVINITLTDRTVNLKVVVSQNQIQLETLTAKIKPVAPKINFYLDHPTRGPLYGQSLNTFVRTTAQALALRAEVFGANDSNPQVTWRQNLSPLSIANDITAFRVEGQTIQNLSATYQDNFFSQAANTIQLQFSNLN